MPSPMNVRQRPGDRRGQRPLSTRPASTLWYGLGLMLVLMMAAQAYWFVPARKQIPYSEFKTLVKSGSVVEVVVGEQSIRGTLKAAAPDGKSSNDFTTTRIEDPKLTEELDAHGVKYQGELVNRWLPDLLGWLLPIVFIVAIWGFFFRRMGSAEGGVMSFARSKAKIYADDEVKIRFSDVAGVDEAEEELKEIVEFLKTPEEVHESRRTHSERRAARRATGNR